MAEPPTRVDIDAEPKEESVSAKTKCYCPGDCNCRYQNAPWHRFNYCGCKAHPPVPPVTHALNAVADALFSTPREEK